MESFLGQILRDNFSKFVIYADRVFRYKSEKQSRTNVLARPNIFRLNNSRPTRSDTDRFTIPLESRLSLSTSKRRGNEDARFEKGKEGRKKERKVEKITIYTHGAFLSLPLNAKLLQRKQNTYVQSRCNTVESIFRRVNSLFRVQNTRTRNFP